MTRTSRAECVTRVQRWRVSKMSAEAFAAQVGINAVRLRYWDWKLKHDSPADASFVSLLASCRLHDIEPWGYLRDLFCLLPSWPRRHVLELAPVSWRQTVERAEVQQRLAGDIFRRASPVNGCCPSNAEGYAPAFAAQPSAKSRYSTW